MRIAVSGAHRTGKTTLVEAVAAELPGYAVIDEPYRLLEDDGYEFSDPPTTEDFERQLRCSIDAVLASPADALLDRCPIDLVAYLRVGGGFDPDDWLDDVGAAIATLDAIVLVPIEVPDRVVLPAHERSRWRRAVHDELQALLLDDLLGLGLGLGLAGGPAITEVNGDLDARVRHVLRIAAR